MKIKPNKKNGFFTKLVFLIFLFAGVLTFLGFSSENPIPWVFGGYQNVGEFHLMYWSLSRETMRDIQNIVKGTLEPEISELWFSKDPPRLRIDKYTESSSIKCNQFKGREWEKITHEGKTYVLMERTIQLDTKRITYYLQNISSGGGEELCEYKRFESTKNKLDSLDKALQMLTFSPYIATPESLEMVVSSLEMDELFNPDSYKQTLNELKKRYESAGRQAAKWETGHGLVSFPAKGFAFIDLEWGIGLEGYLTGQQERAGYHRVVFEKPLCVYKIVSVETKISDPKVFGKWAD